MPNVKFKRGTLAALNTLINGSGSRFEDGSFYLTSDTDRLYVAQSTTELVELNKSITVVQSVSQLPTSGVEVGQFYYVAGNGGANTNNADPSQGSGGNILAVVTSCNSDGTNPHWTLVNPDTNTDHNDNDHVVGFSITKDTTNSVAGSTLVYNWTIQLEDVDNNAISPDLTGSFSIVAADIAQLAGASVGLTSTAPSSNSATISTTGAGSGTGSVTISGASGGNITVGGTANNITLSAVDTKYKQEVDGTNKTVVLSPDDGSSNPISEITYQNGTATTVTVTPSGTGNVNGTIKVDHNNVTRTDPTTVGPTTLAFGASKTIVTGVTSNAQGHITAVATETITLPSETTHTLDSISADNTGHLTVSFDGTPVTSTNADLYYTVNGTPVYNQGTIDFYTKNEIDTMFNGIDAMSYKGNVPAGGLPTTGVKNGDTYTVTADGTYGGNSAKVGDLLIASGTETNGVIPSAGITWNLVPSGNDFNTEYDLIVANNTISLEDNISGSTPDSVTIAGGNKITASTSGTTITLNHDTVSVTGGASSNTGNQNLTYGNTVNVVNGVKADAYGHVEAIYTSTLTMPSTPPDTTESFVVTSSTVNSGGDGTLVLTEDVSNNDKGTVTFANGNLTTAVVTLGASTNTGTVTINHNQITTTATDNTSTATVIDTTNGFNAISAVTHDNYGHITGYTTSKFTLPKAALLKLSGAAGSTDSAVALVTSNTKAKVAFSNVDSDGTAYDESGIKTPQFTLSTSSLKIVATEATASVPGDIAIDIEWGSF